MERELIEYSAKTFVATRDLLYVCVCVYVAHWAPERRETTDFCCGKRGTAKGEANTKENTMYFLRSYQRSQSKEKDKVVPKIVNLNETGKANGEGASSIHATQSLGSDVPDTRHKSIVPTSEPPRPQTTSTSLGSSRERSVPKDRLTAPSVVVLKVGTYGTGPSDPYRRKSISVHDSLYGSKRGSVSISARQVSKQEIIYEPSVAHVSTQSAAVSQAEGSVDPEPSERPLSLLTHHVPTTVQLSDAASESQPNPDTAERPVSVYDTPIPLAKPTSSSNDSSPSSSQTTGTTVVTARPLSPPASFRNSSTLQQNDGQQQIQIPASSHPHVDINKVLAPHGATPIGGTAVSPPRTLLTADGATCQLLLPQPDDCGGQKVCEVLRYFDFRKIVSDDEDHYDYEPCTMMMTKAPLRHHHHPSLRVIYSHC